MEIVVTARHTEVTGRFRRHLEEKLAKVGQLAPKAHRLEVGVSHELNRRQSNSCERIELTLRGKGPVVRAEACGADAYSALDEATTKLLERLRRAGDKRKVHHGRRTPDSVHHATSALAADDAAAPAPSAPPAPAAPAAPAPDASGSAAAAPSGALAHDETVAEYPMGESPVVIREKVHVAPPMGLDDALAQMELVGHDFYLFTDSATGVPSVVYRRRGWSYGVLRLAGDDAQAQAIAQVLTGAASAQDGAGDQGGAGLDGASRSAASRNGATSDARQEEPAAVG